MYPPLDWLLKVLILEVQRLVYEDASVDDADYPILFDNFAACVRVYAMEGKADMALVAARDALAALRSVQETNSQAPAVWHIASAKKLIVALQNGDISGPLIRAQRRPPRSPPHSAQSSPPHSAQSSAPISAQSSPPHSAQSSAPLSALSLSTLLHKLDVEAAALKRFAEKHGGFLARPNSSYVTMIEDYAVTIGDLAPRAQALVAGVVNEAEVAAQVAFKALQALKRAQSSGYMTDLLAPHVESTKEFIAKLAGCSSVCRELATQATGLVAAPIHIAK